MSKLGRMTDFCGLLCTRLLSISLHKAFYGVCIHPDVNKTYSHYNDNVITSYYS